MPSATFRATHDVDRLWFKALPRLCDEQQLSKFCAMEKIKFYQWVERILMQTSFTMLNIGSLPRSRR
jgi:hypothetical protein